MQKLDIMEFWFMEWLINEKKIDMVAYDGLSQEDLHNYEEEFRAFYKSIT